MALANAANQNKADALIFDCISRVLYLEDNFHRELNEVCTQLPIGSHLVGALTLGEIASSLHGGIQFLNKTAVINIFNESKS